MAETEKRRVFTMRKILSKICVLIIVIYAISCCNKSKKSSFLSYINHPRPSYKTRIFDHANLIQHKNSLDSHLKTLYILANIDMVVITFSDLQNTDIDDIAAKLLTNWRIGENTNGLKGILFILSVKEELVRFEIGYDLEYIYTDGFVGYIERDQMAPFFEAGRVQDGIEATLEMIIARVNERIEENTYNPKEKIKNSSNNYYSGGAGTKEKVQIKEIKIPDKTNYPDDIQSLFTPQPTPEEAYLLDIEKCKRHIRGYHFDLYTDETREISKNWVFTKAQMDNEVRDIRGKTFKVIIKGELAIIIFEPQYRNCAPIYLKKNDKGWQLDIATMSKTIHFDMRNQAHIGKSEYVPLFKENGYTFGLNGFLYYGGQEPAYLDIFNVIVYL